MCLGIPSRVLSIDGQVVKLDVMGTPREARLDLLDEPVKVGDYVLTQVGLVTAVLPHDEALETLKLFDIVMASVA